MKHEPARSVLTVVALLTVIVLALFGHTASYAHEGHDGSSQKPAEELRVLVFSGTGWYRHPEGTLAYEWTGEPMPEPARAPDTPKTRRARQTDLRVVDPRTRRTASNAGGHEH